MFWHFCVVQKARRNPLFSFCNAILYFFNEIAAVFVVDTQFGIPRVVVGDVINASSGETIQFLRSRGVAVAIMDPAASTAARKCIELTARFREEKPEQWVEDWGGGPNPRFKKKA